MPEISQSEIARIEGISTRDGDSVRGPHKTADCYRAASWRMTKVPYRYARHRSVGNSAAARRMLLHR